MSSRVLDNIEEEESRNVSVVMDTCVVQFSATASSAAGEMSKVDQSAQFAQHPMRMMDEELQGEVWDLMVEAVDKYDYVPGASDFDSVEFMKEFSGESEERLFMKDVMIRTVHAGLSLAARVIENVDTLRAIHGRGPRDYEESESSGSSTEVYSHWEGDSAWKRSLSRRSDSSDDDVASGPYENV